MTIAAKLNYYWTPDPKAYDRCHCTATFTHEGIQYMLSSADRTFGLAKLAIIERLQSIVEHIPAIPGDETVYVNP